MERLAAFTMATTLGENIVNGITAHEARVKELMDEGYTEAEARKIARDEERTRMEEEMSKVPQGSGPTEMPTTITPSPTPASPAPMGPGRPNGLPAPRPMP